MLHAVILVHRSLIVSLDDRVFPYPPKSPASKGITPSTRNSPRTPPTATANDLNKTIRVFVDGLPSNLSLTEDISSTIIVRTATMVRQI